MDLLARVVKREFCTEPSLLKLLVLLASFAFLSFAQTPVGHDEIAITANSQVVDGSVTHLSGDVVIETDKMLLKTDEADFNKDTLEITARGLVQVKLKRKDAQTVPAFRH